MSQSLITVVDGERTVDLVDLPAMLDPLVEAGMIKSWRPAVNVQGVTLILKGGTTEEQRRDLLELIHSQGLGTVEGA